MKKEPKKGMKTECEKIKRVWTDLYGNGKGRTPIIPIVEHNYNYIKEQQGAKKLLKWLVGLVGLQLTLRAIEWIAGIF